jgi:uncharacterized protein
MDSQLLVSSIGLVLVMAPAVVHLPEVAFPMLVRWVVNYVLPWFGPGVPRKAGSLTYDEQITMLDAALYRLGIVQGTRDDTYYRRLAVWGLGVGIAVTAAGSVWHIATDWSADHAITGTIPTGLGTIPMALGYMAVIILWSRSGSRHVERFCVAGRMALTNYLTQTILGLITLGWLLADVDLTRTMIAVWILGVWALQLWWSTWWLERFCYGPFEWAWRCATYRSWQPLRRPHTAV